MVAQPAAPDLRAERSQLEEEIARLRARLAVAERRAVRAEARGPDPRGFGVGLFVGALVVAGTVGGLFLWMMSVLGHMD
jgi:hypothetical protein